MLWRKQPCNSRQTIRIESSGVDAGRPMHRRCRALVATVALAALQAMAIGTAIPAQARDTTLPRYEPGTIVVKTTERRLYLVLGDGQTLSYPVGVGRPGKTWTGVSYISGKFIKPAWSPPDEVRLDKPGLPAVFAGGTPENPMGAAALTLSGGEYAIHGTNNPRSIGGYVSYGCIRMHNHDIMDLYRRVDVGTRVVVMR
jgi:lipoprotein-anchoring transpeptidase ErfK/SrfK